MLPLIYFVNWFVLLVFVVINNSDLNDRKFHNHHEDRVCRYLTRTGTFVFPIHLSLVTFLTKLHIFILVSHEGN
jgi:hypothetical protein